MSLNAYINDFNNQRTLKEKCFVCKRFLNDNYFTIPITEDDTRAHIKENRMCSNRCMNNVVIELNRKNYGKTFSEYCDGDV